MCRRSDGDHRCVKIRNIMTSVFHASEWKKTPSNKENRTLYETADMESLAHIHYYHTRAIVDGTEEVETHTHTKSCL